MKKPIAAGAAALVVLVAPVAAAHEQRAKVSRAHLDATAAATTAGIPDVRGRAQLVDGRKRDKVSIHVKGLEPGETYLWHVHQATGEGDPCAEGGTVANPAPYPGFTYRELRARPSGNASSKGRSTAFPAETGDTGADYYVDVHLEDGTVIACGVLERKRHAHGKGHGGDDGKGAKGRGHSEHGKGNGRGHSHHDDD